MRKLLLAATLLFASTAWAQTYVNSTWCLSGGSTTSETCTQSITAGDLVVLWGVASNNGISTTLLFTMTSQGDTITQGLSGCTAMASGLGENNGAYITSAVGGSTTVTMTANNSAFLGIMIIEYSGAGSFIDCNNGSGLAGSATTSSITTSANNSLLVGLVWAQGDSGLTLNTVSSGYTTRQNDATGVVFAGGFDSLVNTAGSQTFSASLTPTTDTVIGVLIMGWGGSSAVSRHTAQVIRH